jgi:hypothetical protein
MVCLTLTTLGYGDGISMKNTAGGSGFESDYTVHLFIMLTGIFAFQLQ